MIPSTIKPNIWVIEYKRASDQRWYQGATNYLNRQQAISSKQYAQHKRLKEKVRIIKYKRIKSIKRRKHNIE